MSAKIRNAIFALYSLTVKCDMPYLNYPYNSRYIKILCVYLQYLNILFFVLPAWLLLLEKCENILRYNKLLYFSKKKIITLFALLKILIFFPTKDNNSI